MGIIKAIAHAIGGSFADAWEEVIEADNMTDTTVMTRGVTVRPRDKRNQNKRGTADYISNGSVIHVYPNQFMMLLDGGKVVDFTAEEGYYKVENSSAPSIFAGQLGKAIVDTFSRVKYGGVPSGKQIAVFINLQEIKGIKFGTRSPINYFDNFYNAELFLRTFGTYSIKITDPLKFYFEACSRTADRIDITEINEQYMNEFLTALQSAINQLSVDGVRISQVTSKAMELSKYMASILDADWKEMRGMEVQSVGIGAVSYDEESKKLINMRNQGAMLGDPTVREGYMQGAIARGMEAAGSNSAGAAQAFMGMGVAMGGAGSFMQAASASNQAQRQAQAAAPKAGEWTCTCGAKNTGKFCSECGAKRPKKSSWVCPKCGAENTGKFCAECGEKKPAGDWTCPECGAKNSSAVKFCPECGHKR